jgi:hypothetical protein
MDSQAREDGAAGRLQPLRALLQRNRTAQAHRPIAKNTDYQGESQRHSAPGSAKIQGVSGARK